MPRSRAINCWYAPVLSASGCRDLLAPAAGAQGNSQDQGDHPRGNERHRWAGDPHAGGASCRNLERNRRYYEIGEEMTRFQDRKGIDMVLAMTHEEVVSDLARKIIRSYRQLPLLVYHIQTKWRDESRPARRVDPRA